MEIKVFDLSRDGIGFYLAAMKASEIYQCSRVERISDNAEDGFQRKLDTTRAKKISQYLKSKVIPGAIILSARSGLSLSHDPAKGVLTMPDSNRSLLVIDGQHRLYGSHMAALEGKDVLLPVCILTNLSFQDELNYFIDINSYQKGVPKTLRIELTRFLVEQDSTDAMRLNLFKDLNQEPDSPLFGRLSAEQKGPGYLSHVPFEIAINKTLELPRLSPLPYDQKKQLIKNYLLGVAYNLNEINESSKLTQSSFFQAIFRAFTPFCEQALIIGHNYKKETFEKVFHCIQKIDFRYHTGTNEESISRLEQDLKDKLEISSFTDDTGNLF